MKRTFRLLLVASAVAVTAASLGAVGIDARQGGQAQQSQSSQSSQSQDQSSQPGAQGRDEAAAKQELVQAKQALMDLTKLPEASQLQGEARNGVIQIINSFNSLVTADTNWYDRYQDVQQQLTRILGSDVSGSSASSGAESGSVGTSGAASNDVPPAIRSKLVEFRQHLSAFGKAAGAPDNGAAAGTGSTAASSGSGTGMTSSSGQSTSGSGSQGTSGTQATTSSTQGTSGTMTSAAGETFQQHFDAIADLVQQAMGNSPTSSSSTTAGTSGTSGSTTSGSTTGSGTTGGTAGTSGSQAGTSSATSATGAVTVDRATLEQIQSHLQRLRQLARERGIQ